MARGTPPHFGIHPLQVMTRITSQSPPVLEGDQWSRTFKEFVSLCLVKQPDRRPTIHTLLKHAFVRKTKKSNAVIMEMFDK